MRKKDYNVQDATNSVQVPLENLQDAASNVQVATTSVQVEADKIQVASSLVQDEATKLQDTTPNVQAEASNTQVTKSKRIPNKAKPAEKKPMVVVKEPKRKAFTAMFTLDEAEHLEKCIVNRIQNGLCTSANHFLRQCIDYAVNAEYFTDKNIEVRFATHERNEPWQYKLLKDGVFADKNTGLEVCK